MAEFKPVSFWHGGDYNPDQWLDRPDILEEDIRLMKRAGCNMMSVGIFSWAALEPEEGRYEFGWLKQVIDNLYANGISVLLATPSGARPAWMSAKYPEVLRVSLLFFSGISLVCDPYEQQACGGIRLSSGCKGLAHFE